MTSGQTPDLEPHTPAWWMREIRLVREALKALGDLMPPCLPGEPEDCGGSLPGHYANELAHLMAKAQVLIEVNTPELAQEAFCTYRREHATLTAEIDAGTHLDPRR